MEVRIYLGTSAQIWVLPPKITVPEPVLFFKNSSIIILMEEQLRFDLVKFQKDACILVAEDKRGSGSFFIIREGKVRLFKRIQLAVEDQGDIIGPGDSFGVISAMSGYSNVETAVAETDVVLITVRQDQFGQLIQNKTPVAKNILLMFSKRMRQLNETLAALTIKEEAQPDINHLFLIAEYYVKRFQYKQACYSYYKYIRYCPDGKYTERAKAQLKLASSNIKTPKFEFGPNEAARTYEKDDMIFAEGEPGGEIFIIRGGSVKITRVSKSGEILLAILKPGDIFGEMALLEDKPRGASAVAYEKCDLMVVNQANFDIMIKTQSQLISKLTTLLAERIWASYRQLANTLITDPMNRMYDMLLIQLEKKRVNLDVKGPHTFEFGTKELINMVGLPFGDGTDAMNKMLRSNYVKMIEKKIAVRDVFEFSKYVYFIRKKMEADKQRFDQKAVASGF
jgi:CRP-like cAMP-binding protein